MKVTDLTAVNHEKSEGVNADQITDQTSGPTLTDQPWRPDIATV